MTFDQADRDAVDEILRHLTAASRQEPGCVSYIPHFVEGEACTVLIYEQYADEAALEHHRGIAAFSSICNRRTVSEDERAPAGEPLGCLLRVSSGLFRCVSASYGLRGAYD